MDKKEKRIKQLKFAQKAYHGFAGLSLVIAFTIMILAPIYLQGNALVFLWNVGTGMVVAFFFLYATGSLFWIIGKIENRKVYA